ncbi:hypothetical protein [Mucilaginibacter arboris]|uniref:Uncharacterized protein n=1 Tax=Mucilaginibacter arboris TaxID=2682090 RepID=A0A7K1T094_9SPHI|nr:hypothetical protein [Mucilaginibacter arboris]MVN22937.1 hypothetical protein [Mucilaginibacter arboris]
MKKLLFLSALIAGSLSFNAAKAQIGVHLNVNLGPRPVYVEPAPVVNDYYYLPDAEAYYSVPEHVYYYQNEGRWVSSPRLVGRYHDYDYSRMRHYAVNEPRPYLRNEYYRARYSSPQFAARNNYGYNNQSYGRSYNNGGNYRTQGNLYHNDNHRDGRHDNGNHNGWNRY